MKIVEVTCRDIPDAWFTCIYKILDSGFNYKIQHGSWVGQSRLEFDSITVYIKHPETRPLEPDIPSQYGIPNPVQEGYIEQYLPYLMTPNKAENEDYTYGERIYSQIPHFIELLKKTPNTNQAILQVARPEDYKLNDPPCLRHIDMRIKDNKLIFYTYFRSWDLWAGFPANLGGIQMLKEYMAMEIGVEPGPFICYSKGLHLYQYTWELAELRTGKTIQQFKTELRGEDIHENNGRAF